jgi:hypothetical protein
MGTLFGFAVGYIVGARAGSQGFDEVVEALSLNPPFLFGDRVGGQPEVARGRRCWWATPRRRL